MANTSTPTPGGSNTSDLAALGSLAPLIINMLKGSSQPNPGALLGTLPGGQDLLNGVVGQQQQQAPLRQAVTQQAMNMLPGSAFPGGRPTLSAVGPGPAPVVSDNSGLDIGKLLAAVAASGGLGAALAKIANGSGGGGPLGNLLKALGLGPKGPKIQGNKPYPGGALSPANPYDPSRYFTGWPDDPTTPPDDPLNPQVDTSYKVDGIPGGYPNNPEDPSSIDPEWGGLLGGGLFGDTPGEPNDRWGG